MAADGDGLTRPQEHLPQPDPNHVDAPRFSRIAASRDGTIRLRIEGLYGRAITVEGSEDLINWTAVTDPVVAEFLVKLELATPARAPCGFYRAVSR